MLYNGFKGNLYIDQFGKIAFEISRDRARRFSMKTRNTSYAVENMVFGTLGDSNLYTSGGDSQLENLVFTNSLFKKRYHKELPNNASVLEFSAPGNTGPIQVTKDGRVKVINCSIFWSKSNNQKFVKHIPFAWIFGNEKFIHEIDSFIQSESDFYSSIFGRLWEIVSDGYRKFDNDTKMKVYAYYLKLLEEIENEVRMQLLITQGDEHIFQKLTTRYKFFLLPKAKLIESQPVLSSEIQRKPDFFIVDANDESIYLEIEPPFYKPFIGSKRSARLKMALAQIDEWRMIFSKDSSDKTKKRFIIMIGLSSNLSVEEKNSLEEFNKTQKDLQLATWDYLLDNIARTRKQMNNSLH